MRNTFYFLLLLLALTLISCSSKPKVIEPEPVGGQNNTPIFQEGATTTPSTQEINTSEHKVVIQEALNTDKYTYLRVKENGQENWIAITKRDVKIGSTCYYRGGLMKKNFLSKEFNRTFETLYLVGDFRDESEVTNATPQGTIPPSKDALESPKNVKMAPGAIKISDLVANLSKYDGKTVKVTGKCVKLNPMIMGRNWLHIQDGSGKKLDLTVTTNENIELGSIVTLEGKLALNKDFGAGYKYEYILESAVLK